MLENSIEVTAITEIIATRRIMVEVEVLAIFGIGTEGIKQGQVSKFLLGHISISTELRPGKFLKKLAGRTDIDDLDSVCLASSARRTY